MVGTTTTHAVANPSDDVPFKPARVRSFAACKIATSLASFVTLALGGKASKDELDETIDEGASTDAGTISESTGSDSEAYNSSAEDSSSDVEDEQCKKAGDQIYARNMFLSMRPSSKTTAKPEVRYSTRPRPQEVEEEAQKGKKNEAEQTSSQQKIESPKDVDRPWRSPKNVESAPKEALKPSATSWAEMQRLRRQAKNSEVPDDKAVERTMKSILNKLTIEKFDALYTQLTQCGLRTSSHVESLVAEVFEKATVQHHFIPMYADLCARLNAWFEKEGTPGDCNFRKILLDQCQSQFEKSLEPMKLTSDDEEEREEEASRYKKRMLGNIRLVGELLTRKMLSPKVLIACSSELLTAPFVSDRLESLAALLTTAGPTFDDPSWPYHAVLGHTFGRVLDVSKDTSVPTRVRFLLTDLLELRNSGWKNQKKVTAKEGPKKIEEIHEDAAREKAAKEAPRPQRNNGSEAPRPQRNTGTRPQQQRDNTGSPKPHPRDNNASTTDSPKASPMRQQNRNAPSEKQTSLSASNATKALRPSNTPARSTPVDNAAKVKKAEECSRSLETIFAAANQSSSPPSSPARMITPVASAETQSSANVLSRFHVVLSSVMRELGVTHNTTGAIARIRGLKLPVAHQAPEFANILTRGAEETCSAKRRACFAFAAGLARGTFDSAACAEGIAAFAADIEDLKEEVPQLPSIIAKELEPTLRPVLSEEQLQCLATLA
jgi:hypothetical protein